MRVGDGKIRFGARGRGPDHHRATIHQKENVDRTVGGDAYNSSNVTDVVFRANNLVVGITYMRSRGGEPKPNDTESTRRGAEVVADLASAPLERRYSSTETRS